MTMSKLGARNALSGFIYGSGPQFEVNELRGDGSQGNVFDVNCQKFGSIVAKIGDSNIKPVRYLFRQEAEIMKAGLENVVIVHEYLETSSGVPILLMERGISDVENAIKDGGVILPGDKPYSLTTEDKENIFGDLCNGIYNFDHYLGAQGLRGAHRDVKPSNGIIFYDDEKGRLVGKIGDFGLAVAATKGSTSAKGTLIYRAPEASIGRGNPDWRSDQFGLGLTGAYIFNGTTPVQELYNRLKSGGKDDSEIEIALAEYKKTFDASKSISFDNMPKYQQFILTLLQLDPDKRFKTSATMISVYRNIRPITQSKEYKTLEKRLASIVSKSQVVSSTDLNDLSQTLKSLEKLKELGLEQATYDSAVTRVKNKISNDKENIIQQYADRIKKKLPSDYSAFDAKKVEEISAIVDEMYDGLGKFVKNPKEVKIATVEQAIASFLNGYRKHIDDFLPEAKKFSETYNGAKVKPDEKTRLDSVHKKHLQKIVRVWNANKIWKEKGLTRFGNICD